MVRLFRQLQLIRLFKQLEVRQRIKRALAAAEALPPSEALGSEGGLAAVEAQVMAKYQGSQSRVGQRLSGETPAAAAAAASVLHVAAQAHLETAQE
jgi:hypothetical protein